MKDFEKKSVALEQIVKNLEDENLTLDKAMKEYEKGVFLAKELMDMLDTAESKINVLTSQGEKKFINEEEELWVLKNIRKV